MASKTSPESLATAAFAQHPLSVTPASPLLAASFPLPPRARIAYAVFRPANPSRFNIDTVELARRLIIARRGPNILGSVLCSAVVDKDAERLYSFVVTAPDTNSDAPSLARAPLDGLSLDGLTIIEASSFGPDEVFPCSRACATERQPCPACLQPDAHPQPSGSKASARPSARLLPREPLREPYAHFLRALQDALMDDMCNGSPAEQRMCRYKDSVVLLPFAASFDWGNGWEHHAHTRPLVQCTLHASLQSSRILIQPLFRPTPFVPLVPTHPPARGAPVILLPYGTPAYFLTFYTGPQSALSAQFAQSLTGLGCGSWNVPRPPHTQIDYVIVWLAVQNKQGEEKGLPVVWPAPLVLCHTSQSRLGLTYIPDLAPQLQPSPPGQPVPSLSLSTVSSIGPSAATGTPPPPTPASTLPPALVRRPNLRPVRTPSAKELPTLITLSMSVDAPEVVDVRQVAVAVGTYADDMAQQRERERERMRREAESRKEAELAGETPLGSGNLPTPMTAASAVTSATMTSDTDEAQPDPSPAQPSPFYSSPNATGSAPTTTSIPTASTSASASVAPVPAPPATFETFGAFDDWDAGTGAWAPDAGYEFDGDVSMDLGVGSGANLGVGTDHDLSAVGGAKSSSSWPGAQMDLDGFGDGMDDPFTDADFDYFGAPKPSAPDPTRPALSLGLGPTDASATSFAPATAALGSAALFGEPLHASGPGPPIATSVATATAVAATAWMAEPAPELSPPSETRTPQGDSAPPTPEPFAVAAALPPLTPGFEPITFDLEQRERDLKHSAGKFAMRNAFGYQTPPPEEEHAAPARPGVLSLKEKYDRMTDPRGGLVKNIQRLAGMKRKEETQGGRERRGAWMRGSVDWEEDVLHSPHSDTDDTMSEDESESESDDEVEPVVDDGHTRQATPSPAYLPLGPTLLHTQFRHEHLLPIAGPLKPAGTVAATPPAATTGVTSVPTPVSPAALLGAASERSKTLEAAAAILANEVVESAVWSEAWRCNAFELLSDSGARTGISQCDVRRVACALGEQGTLPLSSVFGTCDVRRAEPPMLAVGKGDALLHVLPSALKFWQKLGLGPRAGRKDVVAFVFYDEALEGRVDMVDRWLKRVSQTYEAANLGSHVPGKSSRCPQDGLVKVKFESFRKFLGPFVSELPAITESYVFYIATPSSLISLSSPVLRVVFSAVKRAQKAYADAQILFQFLPSHLAYATHSPPAEAHALMLFSCSVYDRLRRPADRAMARRLFARSTVRVRTFCQEPAFTIAPPAHLQVQFVRQYPALTLDVMERHTLLHIGYRLCGRWLLAACTDERGQAHDIGVWTTQTDALEAFVAPTIWGFAAAFAKSASVEWRIVLAKLGLMSTSEVDAWVEHLEDVVLERQELPMVHVSLISVDPDTSWTFVAQPSARPAPASGINRTSKTNAGAVLADTSLVTHFISHPFRLDFLPPPSYDPSALPYVPDPTDLPVLPPARCPMRPLQTATLVHCPPSSDVTMTSMLHLHLLHAFQSQRSTISDAQSARTLEDVTKSFDRLAMLARARSLKASEGLPWHLAALEVMEVALSGSGAGEL
ncbi:hypothetical protein K488DRAFT_90914 [Vararia minispora EC-137]|uniref:Uncharacterized protein n=1 Tax=Vararia minispora EC-137 TaxID=1314806 RepID=A0ACB8Q6Q7_9AGAM|nr:hypothetical protein K488DRAFT_90914 [Vararia minispora EC-137]